MKRTGPPVAQDFMQPHVRSVTPEMSLEDVTDYLLKYKISNAPVVAPDHGRDLLLGFISERDCLQHLSGELFYGSPRPKLTAQNIMKTHPVCVTTETEIFDLVTIFVQHGYRHLPVVNDDELLGIVSRRDVLSALQEHYRQVNRDDRAEHFRPDPHQLINHRFILKS